MGKIRGQSAHVVSLTSPHKRQQKSVPALRQKSTVLCVVCKKTKKKKNKNEEKNKKQARRREKTKKEPDEFDISFFFFKFF